MFTVDLEAFLEAGGFQVEASEWSIFFSAGQKLFESIVRRQSAQVNDPIYRRIMHFYRGCLVLVIYLFSPGLRARRPTEIERIKARRKERNEKRTAFRGDLSGRRAHLQLVDEFLREAGVVGVLAGRAGTQHRVLGVLLLVRRHVHPGEGAVLSDGPGHVQRLLLEVLRQVLGLLLQALRLLLQRLLTEVLAEVLSQVLRLLLQRLRQVLRLALNVLLQALAGLAEVLRLIQQLLLLLRRQARRQTLREVVLQRLPQVLLHVLREGLGQRLSQVLVQRLGRLDQRRARRLGHGLLGLCQAVQALGHAGGDGALMVRLRRGCRWRGGSLMLRSLRRLLAHGHGVLLLLLHLLLRAGGRS